MEDLFYSLSEKKLFWVAGYTDNSYGVKEIISVLENNRNYFIKSCKLPTNALVKTDYITVSRRYKSIRYFWVDDVETPPKEAFILNDDWTMHKWISN
jgi:hypothetical protein